MWELCGRMVQEEQDGNLIRFQTVSLSTKHLHLFVKEGGGFKSLPVVRAIASPSFSPCKILCCGTVEMRSRG